MSCPRNQNGNQTKLQIDIIQREHTWIRSSKWKTLTQKVAMQNCKGRLKSQCFHSTGCFASWYSINGQNDEIQTDISCHKISAVCAATRDQPRVHKVSQPVPGIKIESYILATFLNTMTFSGEIMQKSLTTY